MKSRALRDESVLLFLHVPKAGGTTLAAWLYDLVSDHTGKQALDGWWQSGVLYYPAGYVAPPASNPETYVRSAAAQPDLRAVMGHFPFGIHRDLDRPFRYITMLRDPVSRVLSLYHFHQLNQHKWGGLEGVRLPGEMTLADFLREPPYCEIDNGITRRLSGVGSRRPIGQCDSTMLEQAQRHLQDHFCGIGLMENFDESLLLFAETCGWHDPPLYYPKNVNPQRNGVAVDADDQQLVRQHNALDIALYDFARELFGRQIAECGPEFPARVRHFRTRLDNWLSEQGTAPLPD